MSDRVNVLILALGIFLMIGLVLGVKAGERVVSERLDSAATEVLGLR